MRDEFSKTGLLVIACCLAVTLVGGPLFADDATDGYVRICDAQEAEPGCSADGCASACARQSAACCTPAGECGDNAAACDATQKACCSADHGGPGCCSNGTACCPNGCGSCSSYCTRLYTFDGLKCGLDGLSQRCGGSCLAGTCGRSGLCGGVSDWWQGQQAMFYARNRAQSDHLSQWNRSKFGYFYPTGCCGNGCAPLGCYGIAYAADPNYFDPRDGRVFAAQGTGLPMAVPLAPVVRQTYNYSATMPSSRITPISRVIPRQ